MLPPFCGTVVPPALASRWILLLDQCRPAECFDNLPFIVPGKASGPTHFYFELTSRRKYFEQFSLSRHPRTRQHKRKHCGVYPSRTVCRALGCFGRVAQRAVMGLCLSPRGSHVVLLRRPSASSFGCIWRKPCSTIRHAYRRSVSVGVVELPPNKALQPTCPLRGHAAGLWRSVAYCQNRQRG